MKRLLMMTCAAVAAFMAIEAMAADYVWTPSSALWHDANWNNGANWVDGNTSVFGATSQTDVTISGEVSAYDVYVSGADYSFSGNGTIKIPNGYFDVAAGRTAVVNCGLSQPNSTPSTANRLRKSGEGTLVLKGSTAVDRYLHMSGNAIVDGGTFRITSNLSGAGVNTLPAIFANGGRFEVTGGASVYFKGSHIMNCGVELFVTNGLLDFSQIKSEFLNAYYPGISDNRAGTVTRGTSSVLTVQDKGIVTGTTFRISQGNGLGTGTVNLNTNGVLSIHRFKNDSGAAVGAVNFNGGLLVRRSDAGSGGDLDMFGSLGNANWNGITLNVLEGGFHFMNEANATADFNRPLVGGAAGRDGGFHMECATDSLVNLNCENSYNGGTFLGALGNLCIKNDRGLGAVPSMPETNILFNGSTAYLRTQSGAGTVELDANRTVAAAPGAIAGFCASSGTELVVYGRIMAEAGKVRVLGNSSNYDGITAFDPGAGVTNRINYLQVTGFADIRSGHTELLKRENSTGANATLYVAANDSARDFGNEGRCRISGGSVKAMGGRVQTSNYGHLEVENANVDFTGCNEILNAHGSLPGRISVLNGGVLDCPAEFRLTQSTSDLAGVYLATGGVMRMSRYKIDTSMNQPYHGSFVFDGGKVVVKATAGSFFGTGADLYTNVHVRINRGGAIFDTNGFVTRIFPDLERGDGGNGGLTKLGGRHLILHGTNSYTGTTRVMEGTLRLSAAKNVLWPESTLVVNTNAVCEAWTDFLGTVYQDGAVICCTQTLGRVEGCGTVVSSKYVTVTGAVAPGMGEDGVGTITLDTACRLGGKLEIDASETDADCLVVQKGVLDVSGLTLKISVPASFEAATCKRSYTIISSPDGITGSFAGVEAASSNWELRYTENSVVLRNVRGTKVIVR